MFYADYLRNLNRVQHAVDVAQLKVIRHIEEDFNRWENSSSFAAEEGQNCRKVYTYALSYRPFGLSEEKKKEFYIRLRGCVDSWLRGNGYWAEWPEDYMEEWVVIHW